MKNDTYYSIIEVSKLLKVVYLTVYRWVRAKKLKAYQIEKQYRIKNDDLNRFIESRIK
jgi:excisionase family DNA binding protein